MTARMSSTHYFHLVGRQTGSVCAYTGIYYGTSYLSYLPAVLLLLPKFVALHLSRYTKTSAPRSDASVWTLEHVGFDLHVLEETGTAWFRRCFSRYVE
jgi:hypothetical protein